MRNKKKFIASPLYFGDLNYEIVIVCVFKIHQHGYGRTQTFMRPRING